MASPQPRRIAAAGVNRKTNWEAIDRGSAGFEDIAGAANSVDQLFRIRIVHFGAQTSHHDIEDIRASLKIDSPDMVLDLVTRDDLSGRANQLGKKKKFLGGEMER